MAFPLTGQIQVADTAVAPAVTNNPGWFQIKAPRANTTSVYWGDSTVTVDTGHCLDPGETFEFERRVQQGHTVIDVPFNNLYVCGTPGDKVTWVASQA